MDRPLAPWLLLSLTLFTTCSFADLPVGAAEYNAALETGDKLATLMAQMIEVSDAQAEALSESAKADVRDQVLGYLEQYPEQLKGAAELGFAPAQFMYAQYFRAKAITQPAQRAELKAQACDLLEKSAASGLFAASLAKGRYCSSADPRDFDSLVVRAKNNHQALLEAIKRPDPFADYYPLPAFGLAECFLPERNPFASDLTPLQSLQANQPPSLTLDKTLAEGFYQLASHENAYDKPLAKEHLAKAEALGCSERAVAGLKKYLIKPTQP